MCGGNGQTDWEDFEKYTGTGIPEATPEPITVDSAPEVIPAADIQPPTLGA